MSPSSTLPAEILEIRKANRRTLPPITKDILRDHGIVSGIYLHTPIIGLSPSDNPFQASEGIPEDVLFSLLQNRAIHSGPTVKHALWSGYALTATADGLRKNLVPELSHLVDEIEKIAPEGWMVLPVFGPLMRNGMFVLRPDSCVNDIEADTVWALHVICQAVHIRTCQVFIRMRFDAPQLSQRQREVLHWLACGKSKSEMSTIMSLSTHTIDANIRKIFHKLDVSDRVSAIVRGLGYGMITNIPR